ncbi:MAG: ATP-binding protein [Planctomycetota bacterium]
MTKKITEVTQMTGGSEGISLLIDSWRNQISQDQQYREFTQNSIESVKRVQKQNPEYKGIIKWEVDEPYFNKHKVKKLCIIDNGEGMTPQEMLENINTLGGSTRNNEYYNHGCGAKIAGLAHNRAGIIYRSWKNGQGYMMKFMRNQMGRYGAVKMQGRNSFEISNEMKPSVIQNHGCVVTLLGDDDREDTTIPSDKYGFLKGSRISKSEWLTCYLNTKFYNVPNNIKITASRFDEDKNQFYIIKGHEHGLTHDFADRTEEIQLTKTKVKIFYREKETIKKQTQYMTNGQLGIINQDEVIKLEFVGSGGFNVLPAWGLQCLKKQVALMLIPEGHFKQNIERTDLVHDGMKIQEQLNLWKTEFKEKMPEWLREIEAKKQQEQLDKDNDNAETLKKLAPLFKKERYYNSETGDVDIEKDDKRKASSKGKIKGEDNNNSNLFNDPKDDYGEVENVFGTKVDRSKFTGRKVHLINEYPELLRVKEGASHLIGSFVKDTYTIEINVESNLVNELVNYIHKKFPKIMKTVLIDEVFKMIGLGLQQQVAHVYNRTDSTEEEIDNALSSLSLTACAANKDYVVQKLTTKLKGKDIKNNFPANRDEHMFHVKNNPNRFMMIKQ